MGADACRVSFFIFLFFPFFTMNSEKSIIKTLQSQQKQFMEENRRRAERNESILRNLERIDYQASVLAQKTDRLRAMKVHYMKHLQR